MLYLILRLVHILFMATWVGAVFFTSGDVRRTLTAGPEHLELLKDRVRRSDRLTRLSGILTLVSGFALIFEVGGMAAVSPAIHIAMTLAIVAYGVGMAGIEGSWKKIVAALDAGGSAESVAPLLKRMRVSTMIFHALWLVILVMMVFRSQIG